MKTLTSIFAILLLFGLQGIATAQIPQTISYQGLLTNSDGTAISNGNYSVTFNLYKSVSGGPIIWSEVQSISVEDGIFNAIMGSSNPFDLPFDSPYWLGISVEGGHELEPRIELTSSPYSLNTRSIPNNSVTNEKVANGNLVRSINSITDDVTISAGSNISIYESTNSIIIAANASTGGFTLPYSGNASTIENTFTITNNEFGYAIHGKNTSTGGAGLFEIDNSDNISPSLFAKTNGRGIPLKAYTSGRGSACDFRIYNEANDEVAVGAYTNGKGGAGAFVATNTGNPNPALFSSTNGTGNSFKALMKGTGKAAYFEIDNSSNNQPAIFATTNGTGEVAKLIIDKSSNNNEVLFAQTNGGGYAIYAENTGTTGNAGRFDITNNASSKTSLQTQTSGTGKAIYCAATNKGSITNYGGYFLAGGSTGYAVWAEATNTSGVNYGGHFSTASSSGRAIRGHATNTSGENYGGAFRADGSTSRAVWAFGQSYDYYAAGPGINYGAASSVRWKNNIIEIDSPLEKIKQLRGVYFDWDIEHGGKHDVGMIAEEVGKVLPEIVTYETNNTDAEGMDYSKITPLLVEAIKAQQKIIEELKNDISELKGTIKN